MNLESKKGEFEQIFSQLQSELSKLRTNRANPAMVEDLKVNYYGSLVPIKQLASIVVPEPRQLLVSPWDKNVLSPVEKAIRDSGLGLNPVNEGEKVRVTLPELTYERRQELSKVVGRVAEEARIRLRNHREVILKEVKKQEDDGAISEDARFRVQEKLQELIDQYNKKIKDLAEDKEKEILTI